MPQCFLLDTLSTPLGDLLIIADEQQRLRAVEWKEYEEGLYHLLARRYKNDPFELTEAVNPGGLTQALARYFAGDLQAIDTLAVASLGTAFQQRVWQELRKIPCGTTITYGELAARLGSPTASRAVGMANGSNPVSIVVPCHCVIGANGALTGYAGGVQRKAWLLAHEGAIARQGALSLCNL
ncbi:methylated-DNA--[protein]-cysteine S-methyltransferase [Symbiopectobacterium sp.]|uniref:methylated-DNA--[protein]-cysteine S-methyltransferase n=1 Tax=Symbiopectobacterium sp. TaxID=2952789 RepID=UPI003F3C416A